MRAQITTIEELSDQHVRDWSELSAEAIEPNPYLAPEFVLPACRWLKGSGSALIARVENSSGSLTGLGVLAPMSRHLRFPFHSLRDFTTTHSFLGGVLLGKGDPVASFSTMASALLIEPGVNAITLSNVPADGAQWAAMHAAGSALGLTWVEGQRYSRATVAPGSHDHEVWEKWVSKGRRRSISRGRARLEAQGALTWRIGTDGSAAEVERFLMLEHSGWKGAAGTSLRSLQNHEMFFREMIRGFADRHGVFFTELLLNGQPVAATCNLMTGQHGFAFKVAYDERYRKCNPGIINEVQFLEDNPLKHVLVHLDSGASAGSFVESIWPGRRLLVSGKWVVSGSPSRWCRVVQSLRKLKRRVR